MLEYRLIVLDGTGFLHMPHEFQAADDAAAISDSEAFCFEGRHMELWQDDRKVRCWGFEDCPSSCD